MIKAAITAVGGYAPDYILTNEILSTMVDTNDEWITSRTGIKERRILKGEGLGSTDMAVPAVKEMLAKKNIDPKEIDLVIFATVTPDRVFPASANILSRKVGMTNAWGFDVNAACSGFLFALQTAAQFIASGTHKKIVVVGADKMSAIVDYTDRKTCVIFGDGCGAVLLEPSEDGNGIQDALLFSDGTGEEFLHQIAGGSVKPPTHETVDAREHYIYQEGQSVFKFAVTNMAEAAYQVMQRNQLVGDDIAYLVPHQANKRIIDATARGMDIGEDKVMINIQKYGNTTNATIPLCLFEWQDKLKKGDNLILAAFGGGFTWGAMYIKWAI